MKKSLVGKTRDGGKLFFVSGGRSTGIFQIGRTMTEVNFWDFVDKRPDLEEMMVTPMQKKLWSRNISDPQWVAQFMPAHWRKQEDGNPYNQKVSQALDTIRTTTDLLF
jgi:hypothetical protein